MSMLVFSLLLFHFVPGIVVKPIEMSTENTKMEKTYFIPRHVRATWANTRVICKSFGMDILGLETEDEANLFHELMA